MLTNTYTTSKIICLHWGSQVIFIYDYNFDWYYIWLFYFERFFIEGNKVSIQGVYFRFNTRYTFFTANLNDPIKDRKKIILCTKQDKAVKGQLVNMCPATGVIILLYSNARG